MLLNAAGGGEKNALGTPRYAKLLFVTIVFKMLSTTHRAVSRTRDADVRSPGRVAVGEGEARAVVGDDTLVVRHARPDVRPERVRNHGEGSRWLPGSV